MRTPKIRVYKDGEMMETITMMGGPDGVSEIEGASKKHGVVTMMSTEVRDINGVEIYEGDICERECGDKLCEDKHVGIVEYDTQDGSYVLANPKKGFGWPMVANILAEDGRSVVGRRLPKVLGNGYQNPALYKLL